jgi:hypothetical protein
MPKHTARRHKVAVHHAPAARQRRHGKVMRGQKPVEMTQTTFKPMVVEVVDVEFLNDPVEVLADDAAVTGFEDEDL